MASEGRKGREGGIFGAVDGWTDGGGNVGMAGGGGSSRGGEGRGATVEQVEQQLVEILPKPE